MSKTMSRAYGALPWRIGSNGALEVLLVHRPRHGDWSIPKGKAEPGESPRACARREVREETGLRCRLGAELPAIEYEDRKKRRKTIRYWAAAVQGGHFKPNSEVDVIRWVSLPAALRTLTEPRDRPVVLALAARLQLHLDIRPIPATETALLLVRGAKATPRSMDPDNQDRPLAADGEKAAQSLAALGSLFRIERILSAPPPRCMQTVAELARHQGLDVERSDHLAEGRVQAAMELVQQARGIGTVLCTHEDVLAGVIGHLICQDRMVLDKRFRIRKGSSWILTGDDTRYHSAYYLPLPAAGLT